MIPSPAHCFVVELYEYRGNDSSPHYMHTASLVARLSADSSRLTMHARCYRRFAQSARGPAGPVQGRGSTRALEKSWPRDYRKREGEEGQSTVRRNRHPRGGIDWWIGVVYPPGECPLLVSCNSSTSSII